MIRRLPNLVIHKKPWKILEVPAGAETNNPELIGLFALRVTIVYLFPQKARLVKQVHFLQRWERSLSNNEVLALHPQSWQNFAALQIDQRIGSDDLQVSPPSMYLYHMLELLHCPWQELRVLFCPSLLYLQFLVELIFTSSSHR